jgi:short-chain Z-isoprenyl diphosphate synthase
MGLRDVMYGVYARHLVRDLTASQMPKHVGVILDGNRRWATMQGTGSEQGHRAGAAKIEEFLGWCEQANVEVVTLWLLSTDNLERPPADSKRCWHHRRDGHRLAATQMAGAPSRGAGPAAGPPPGAEGGGSDTENVQGLLVNVAVGYGGRREVVDAVRGLLVEHHLRGTSLDDLAAALDAEAIAEHLYTRGQPDPDLVIRTSGEQRLSGFLLWQSAHSEFYFCEAYWPDFRRIDFLRALRAYSQRHRRFGS